MTEMDITVTNAVDDIRKKASASFAEWMISLPYELKMGLLEGNLSLEHSMEETKDLFIFKTQIKKSDQDD